jgi:hypothetical protein
MQRNTYKRRAKILGLDPGHIVKTVNAKILEIDTEDLLLLKNHIKSTNIKNPNNYQILTMKRLKESKSRCWREK